MVLTPAALALASTWAPVAESRLTIARTETPSWIIPSAMDTNLVLSPRAFWMSAETPASVNALVRSGLSKLSQRAEDCVSGRITPTLPFALLEPDELDPPALLFLELLQAARVI